MADKITFEDLKTLSERMEINDEEYFVNYLNGFKGKNTLEKFRNILQLWERDVSYDITVLGDEKNIKLHLSYLLKELGKIDDTPILIENGIYSFEVGIPEKFSKDDSIFSPYNFIKSVTISGKKLNFDKLSQDEKKSTLDIFPAKAYNKFIRDLNNVGKILKFENISLKSFKINFISGDPYLFLRGLCQPYRRDYLLDLVYHLSSKIGGDVLSKASFTEIDYYIAKLNEERKSNPTPELG